MKKFLLSTLCLLVCFTAKAFEPTEDLISHPFDDKTAIELANWYFNYIESDWHKVKPNYFLLRNTPIALAIHEPKTPELQKKIIQIFLLDRQDLMVPMNQDIVAEKLDKVDPNNKELVSLLVQALFKDTSYQTEHGVGTILANTSIKFDDLTLQITSYVDNKLADPRNAYDSYMGFALALSNVESSREEVQEQVGQTLLALLSHENPRPIGLYTFSIIRGLDKIILTMKDSQSKKALTEQTLKILESMIASMKKEEPEKRDSIVYNRFATIQKNLIETIPMIGKKDSLDSLHKDSEIPPSPTD